MRKLRVFVSGPISTVDPADVRPAYEQIVEHVRAAVQAGSTLLEIGAAPYVPHLTHFWNMMAPQGYETWMELDRSYLDVCDVVLRLPGKSHGADREVAYAQGHGIPIVHTIEDLFYRNWGYGVEDLKPRTGVNYANQARCTKTGAKS